MGHNGRGAAPCLMCQAEAWESVMTIRRPEDATMRALTPTGTAQVLRCRRCGLMVTHPLPTPEQIPALYPEDTYPCYAEARRGQGLKRWVLHRVMRVAAPSCPVPVRYLTRAMFFPVLRRVGGVPTPRPTRRLLDIGCGDGAFLEAIHAAGWEGVGVEMNPTAAAAARARGLAVETGTLETCSFPEGSFSVVRLWHVLEHLMDPSLALRKIRRWLAPGGELILGIPNAASLSARVFGPRWTAWELPRHLYHFTPLTITRLLRAQGLVSIRVRHSSVGTIVSSLGPAWDRHVWLRALGVVGDTLLDGLACGDSLEIRAVQPSGGGDDA